MCPDKAPSCYPSYPSGSLKREIARLHEMVIGQEIEIVARQQETNRFCGPQVKEPNVLGRPLRARARLHEVVFGWTLRLLRDAGNNSMSVADK
jgi:hypothetical protein